jgi:hypothetical protein
MKRSPRAALTSRLFCVLTAALLSSLRFLSAAEPSPNKITEEDKAGGWKLLFDGTTSGGWHSFKKATFPTNEWQIEDGWLHCVGKKGGDLISDAEFDNFELEWDWKEAPAANSGIKYFVSEKRDAPLGHEYQMIDDARNPDARAAQGKRVTGSFYDVLKLDRPAPTKPQGEINHSKIVVKGNQVEHWLNGAKVLTYSCGSEAEKAAIAASKFKDTPGFGDKIKGHILLQNHRTQVWFQNIRIRELPAT